MRLLLIRHGQTTSDVEDRYGGAYDDHLTDEGRQQSEALMGELSSAGIEQIISSSLIRAQETAEIISGGRLPITTEADFRERNQYGILSGIRRTEALEKYPEQVALLKDRYNTLADGESYEDFVLRLTRGFHRLILSEHACIAVVWHSGPMRVLFRDILKKGELANTIGDCAWIEVELNNGACSVLDTRRMECLFSK